MTTRTDPVAALTPAIIERIGDQRYQLWFAGNTRFAWDGDEFTREEKEAVRTWLFGKAMSIYGGSFEIQNNIISKNILGLPETTQKG